MPDHDLDTVPRRRGRTVRDPDTAVTPEEEAALDAHDGSRADRLHRTEDEGTMLRSDYPIGSTLRRASRFSSPACV